MPKNIVIFSDGTGQEGGKGHDTNIYKMFNMVEDRTTKQIAFYDRGLGTGWRKISGLIGGFGISKNIRECYEFIFNNFQAGDQIFLFGFSRGAATVRSLSSFIHYFGVLPKSRPELIKKAYSIYKENNEEKRKRRAEEFIEKHHTMWTRIKVLGCYDTVAALGLPYKTASAILDGIPGFRHKFHNFQLSETVENAFHALAIDDERKTFHPVLWESECLAYQKIQQVWFAGMHTDVGGGYEEQTLSNIPLVWMIQKAIELGLRIYPGHDVKINEDQDGFMHDSRRSLIGKLYRRKQRFWPESRTDKPVVHQSALERKKNQKNENNPKYAPWITQLEYDVEPWKHYKNQNW
jgi:uncharacterized protein (DUF2235 family)